MGKRNYFLNIYSKTFVFCIFCMFFLVFYLYSSWPSEMGIGKIREININEVQPKFTVLVLALNMIKLTLNPVC